MGFPAFFAAAPTLTLRDPLARFLGAAADGEITYEYADAVRLAGHSCPTVAGAWLMLRRGLAELYGAARPERGAIEVWMRDGVDHGTTGVIAQVATLVTGAAAEGGFGGIGAQARFARRGLLLFNAPIDGVMALGRRDDGRRVVLDLATEAVPPSPELPALFRRAASGDATDAESQHFGALWQERVRAMLLEHADDPRLIRSAPWRRAA